MSDETRSTPNVIQLAKELDAAYASIPDFSEFLSCHIDVDLGARKLDVLSRRRANAEPWLEERAVRRLFRSAAMDTGALEGLYETDRNVTLSVAVEAAGWREELRTKGNEALRFFEAQLSGFEWFIEQADPLTERTICDLHAHICEPQSDYEVMTPTGAIRVPLPKGQYKKHPNHVVRKDGSRFAYAPVHLTSAEMLRFTEIVRSNGFTTAHTVLKAAYAHYAFIRIHPFADGNGRVARALSSALFVAKFGVPLVMFFDERAAYFKALSAADNGDYQPFVDFVFDRGMETFSALADELRAEPEVVAARLEGRLKSHGGLPHLELDAMADTLLTMFTTELSAAVQSLSKMPGVQVAVGGGSGGVKVDAVAGHRYQSSLKWTSLQISLSTPVSLNRNSRFGVFIAKDVGVRYPFLVATLDGGERYEVLLQDLLQASAALRVGLKAWTRGVVSAELNEFDSEVSRNLEGAGFLPPKLEDR